jgi:tRNA(Ile2) C34 agmatinyltransferase TiaS
MAVTTRRKPGPKTFDKLARLRRFEWAPPSCPRCGIPMYVVSTGPQIRYLKCGACGKTGKETR